MCRGQEADDTGLPCPRCDGYGVEPTFPPEGPEPGRDFIEWAHAKVREAHTVDRTHTPGCHRWHLDCANAEINRLRGLLASGRATYTDIHYRGGDA